MALTPAQNDALIREIDEAVRHDDLRSFWSRYGRWLIAAVVVALVAFGAWLLWQDRRQKDADTAGERYAQMIASVERGKPDRSAISELSDADQAGYNAGARLTQAALLSAKGDIRGAAAAYAQIAADEKLDAPYRDLASVRRTALEFDTMSPQTVIDRMKPYVDPKNPWFGSAAELTGLALLKLGRKDEAGRLFGRIAQNRDTPRTIQTRAVQMASLLGVDAEIAPAAAEEDNAADAE